MKSNSQKQKNAVPGQNISQAAMWIEEWSAVSSVQSNTTSSQSTNRKFTFFPLSHPPKVKVAHTNHRTARIPFLVVFFHNNLWWWCWLHLPWDIIKKNFWSQGARAPPLLKERLVGGVTATFTFLSFVLRLPHKILSLLKPVNIFSLKTGHVKEATRLLQAI